MRRREPQAALSARAGLNLSASTAVLATLLTAMPQSAAAQAFQGTPTAILGTVNRVVLGNTEQLQLTAQQTTLNWVPTDTGPGPAAINFLPAGSSATFVLAGANGPWTVLNRVLAADPTRAIQLAGSVNADVFGRVWFYAPGGLLISNTAQFNVGGLLLTANDPVGAAAGNPFIDATGGFQLAAAANSTAAVNIAAGATITSDSYMIAVAPRFTMNGTATVGTSAALVAAEDVSFTLNGGLFDITANVGSAAGGTSDVRGSITGAGGDSATAVYSRIYMMAVPRNTAMTLLITGGAQLGFAVANAADIDGNAVVLSGGYDIVGSAAGSGLSQFGAAPVAGSTGAASILVNAGNVTSNLTLRSKDSAQVQATSGAITTAQDLDVYADTLAVAGAFGGNTLSVGRNLTVDASNYLNGSNGADRQAGNALVEASSGGLVQVQLRALVRSVGTGDNASGAGQAGGTGTGGRASVGVGTGSSFSAFSLDVDASGIGGDAVAGMGGSGIGLLAEVLVDTGGQLNVTQSLGIVAQGSGSLGESGQLSGNAEGGDATLTLLGGTINVPNALLSLDTDANYKFRDVTAHLGGGQVIGGDASVNVQSGSVLTSAQLSINAIARSSGGSGNNAYRGGNASLIVNDVGGVTSVTVQSIDILAIASASDGEVGGNTAGGAATGGFARLLATGNPTISGTQIFVNASANGGDGADEIGGAALGGRAHLDMQNGGSLLMSGVVSVGASASGGDGTTGGNATAYDNGDAQPPAAFVRLGPNVGGNDQGMQLGSLSLNAVARGGDGTTGTGGSARGGFVVLRGQSGDINANFMDLQADATGGFGVGGGAGQSGRLFGAFDNANLTTSQFFLNVDSRGGDASNGGRGGDATVGQVLFLLSSLESGPGTTINAGSASLLATAQGGSGGSSDSFAGAGGDAFGANPLATQPSLAINVQPARATFTAASLLIDNEVTGGRGGLGLGVANGGAGGAARGGSTSIGVDSGPIVPVANRSVANFGAVTLNGRTTGGEGGSIEGTGLGGRGGNALAGAGTLLSRGGIVTAASVLIDVSGVGGNGGASISGDLGAGNGTGGLGRVLATPEFASALLAQVTITGGLTINATGRGGEAVAGGGIGSGGIARIALQRNELPGAAPATVAGSLIANGLVTLDASAFGGNGRDVAGIGGTGGNAVGGTGELLVGSGGSVTFPQFAMLANANGGNGASAAIDGAGGDAAAGTLRAMIDGAGPGALTLAVGGTAQFTADAVAGRGGNGGTGGAGGDGTGGVIEIGSTGNGGTFAAGFVLASADVDGGNGGVGTVGGAGGTAVGGNITIGMGVGASAATPGSFTASAVEARGRIVGGVAGGAAAAHGAATGGSARLIINGATATVTGDVLLETLLFAGGFAPGVGALATGGRNELGVGNAANGSAAGQLTINGATVLQTSASASDSASPVIAGVNRVFANGNGSRLTLGSLNATASTSGSLSTAPLERSGLVAGVGATIAADGNVLFLSARDVGLNDGGTITATGEMFVSSGGQVLSSFGTPTAGATGTVAVQKLEISATQGIDLVTNTTGSGDVFMNSSGQIRLVNIDSNRDISIFGAAGVSFTSMRADRNLGLFSDVAINGGNASAGGRILLTSDGSITTGALASGITDPAPGVLASIYVRALGAITVGNVSSARNAALVGQGGVTAGNISTAGDTVLLTGGNLAAGSVVTGATSQLYAGQFGQRSLISFPADLPPDFTALLAAAPLRLPGSISFGGAISTDALQLAATGAILFGGVVTASSVSLDSAANIGVFGAGVDDNLTITSDGTVTLGATSVGGAIRVSAGAAISAGALSAGTHIVLRSPGLVTTGSLSALDSVILSGITGVNTGNITAGNGLVLLDTGGITTGALSTSPQGFVYIASHLQLPQISFDAAGNPDFAALLAAAPQRLDGLIGIGGPVQTGRLIAAATGNFTATAITAPNRVLIDVGGLANLNGNIASAEIVIRSADIAIAPEVTLGANGSSVRLLAGGPATTLRLGGNAAAAAGVYSLSNAEFGALRASNILVDMPSGTMVVEALSLPSIAPQGSAGGKTALPGDGVGTALEINPAPAGITLASSGVLRVTGAVTMAQAGAANRLNLISGSRIEVVQGSGSIRLGSNIEAPTGSLGLTAPSVRAASDALLGQIAAGTLTGAARTTALNAAQAGGDPTGSIGAGSIAISAATDVLIQNSGAASQRAGFTAGIGGLSVTRTGSAPLDMVINGRILGEGLGFAINIATLDAVGLAPGVEAFTATSTVNNCVINAACAVSDTLQQALVTILTSVEPLTFKEQEERERLAQPADKLPIIMLQRLFDFGPMFREVDVTDPVTSGGNPALWLEYPAPDAAAPGGPN